MTSFQTIHSSFRAENIAIQEVANYFVAENTMNCTPGRISEILTRNNFSPIVSSLNSTGKYAFTVAPHILPDSFPPISVSEKIVNFFRERNRLVQQKESNIESYGAHCTKSKQVILSAAQGLTGSALVVAIGNEKYIPLKELCEQFSEVVITDIDLEGMKESVRRLPANLQPKVKLFQHDLTGLLAPLALEMESLTATDCVTRLASSLEAKLATDPAVISPGKFNYVVSAMIAGLVGGLCTESIKTSITTKFGAIVIRPPIGPKLASLELDTKLCLYHLNNLSRWTLNNGRICFIDDFYSTQTALMPHAYRPKEMVPVMVERDDDLPQEKVRELISQRFTEVGEMEEWPFVIAEPTATELGAMRMIKAYKLQPKVEPIVAPAGIPAEYLSI